jgi:hypothetical protein
VRSTSHRQRTSWLMTAPTREGKPGFSYPLILGIISILFSSGKGLLFYFPNLLLILNRNVRSDLGLSKVSGIALSIFTSALVVAYAGWWSWYGGNFWGPRFFLIFAFPASMFLALLIDIIRKIGATFWMKIVVLVILIWTTWVGINGYFFGEFQNGVCIDNDYQLEAFCWYVPEFSPLFRPFVNSSFLSPDLGLFNFPKVLFLVWQILVLVYLSAIVICARGIKKTTSGLGPIPESYKI